jgi:uncharacterized protein YukE
MTLNTYVSGKSGEARSFAQELRKLGHGTEAAVTGVRQARTHAEGEWEGAASKAFQAWAKTQGTDGDALAEVYPMMARAHDVWADEIDTVQARMEQAKQVARDGGLKLMGKNLILPPKAPQMSQPESPRGRATAGQAEQYSQEKAAYDAAIAEMHRQQAVWEEAKSTVEDARQKERAAHETFINAMDRAKSQIKGIGQAQKWAQAGMHPASAAAGGLAQVATALEARSADAGKALLQGAIGKGPAAANAAWSSMSSAQQADLVRAHPGLVGSTDGVPVVARNEANRSILSRERARIHHRIRNIAETLRMHGNPKDPFTRQLISERGQLGDALNALDGLEKQLDSQDKYLIGFAPTEAEGRGHAIVANGNPDTADHVMTYVPGTTTDFGSINADVANTEKVHEQAQQVAPDQKVSTITWSDYKAPLDLPAASFDSYAENATDDLSNFQEGLRATHQGDQPSHNTVVGHSYGSTTVGYTARDANVHADELVFLGSPGVGVDHASELGVPTDDVWGATSKADDIHIASSPTNPFTSTDDHWFGRNPSDPSFGGRTMPVDPSTEHGEYWDKQESRDAMARIITGKEPQ